MEFREDTDHIGQDSEKQTAESSARHDIPSISNRSFANGTRDILRCWSLVSSISIAQIWENALSASGTVQAARTHIWTSEARVLLPHVQAWSVGEQGEDAITALIQPSFPIDQY